MRQDKLTTKLQEALSDAQSLAVGNDNQYIEPVHLLTALLGQDDGSTRSLLQRAGVNINGLTAALKSSLERLPKVSGMDVVKGLRAAGQKFPILILTARSSWQDKVEGLKAGARFFPARGHILGPEYSLADTAWAVLLRRVQMAGLALPPEAASVTAYAARMFARPGFQRCFHPSALPPAGAPRRRG